jgi:CCR4-NOT transcription complex subunit 1
VGLKFVRSKLIEIEANADLDTITTETLVAVMQLLKTHPDLASESVLEALQKAHPEAWTSLTMAPLLETDAMNMREVSCAVWAGPMGDAALLVRDLGYSATHSAEVFRAVLREAGALPLTASGAARIALVVATTMTGLEFEMSPVLVNAILPDGMAQVPDAEGGAGLTSWNLDVVVEVMAGIDVAALSRAFDQPDLAVADVASLRVLGTLLSRINGSAFSVAPFLVDGLWRHPASQLAFLEVATVDPELSFSRAGHSMARLSDLPLPHDAWLCPSVLQVLLLIGDTAHGLRARAIVDRVIRQCPESLAVLLATVLVEGHPAVAASRIFNLLWLDLMPPFFLLPAPKGAAIVVQRLWALRPTLVLRCCRDAYMSQPTAAVVRHLMGIARSVGALLLETPGELAWAVAAMLSDRGEVDRGLNLSAWAVAQLGGGEAATESLLALIARHASRVVAFAAQSPASPPVSLEALSTLLKALDKCSSPQPQLAQKIKEHIRAVLHIQPTLMPLFTTAREEGAAPGTGGGVTVGGGDDIEIMVDSYYQKMYNSNLTVPEVIEMLQRFKTSQVPREQDIFACMLKNLFDECRFFHEYPEKELRFTGILFGTLVQEHLVIGSMLATALRFVLEVCSWLEFLVPIVPFLCLFILKMD